MELEFDENGLVTAWSGNSVPTHTIAEALNGTVSSNVMAIFNRTMSLWGGMKAYVDDVIGFTDVTLEYNQSVVRYYETPIGNLAADAVLHGTGMGFLSFSLTLLSPEVLFSSMFRFFH